MTRIDAIRKEHEVGASYGRFGIINGSACDALGIKKYKLAEGNNFIAIVPPKDVNQFYAKRLFIHYDVGINRAAFLCLQAMSKQPCPICEEKAKISNEDAPDKDLLNELSPSMRYLYFIIDMKNENTILEGIKYIEIAAGLNQDIMTKSKDPRTGEWLDISDPMNGKNIVISRTGTTRTNTKYNVVKFEDRKPGHGEVIKAYMEAAPSFDEVLSFQDYSTIKEEFTGSSVKVAPTAEANKSPAPAGVQAEKPAEAANEKTEVNNDRSEQPKTESISQGQSLADRIKAKLAASSSAK